MRIIAGRFGSRNIVAPKGARTRPTLDRTRESLFSMLDPRLVDAQVLDLFAGSGALGLEALSRGASFVVFCDHDRHAARAIRQNMEMLGVQEQGTLLAMDYRRAVTHLSANAHCFDLIFLDPPYALSAEPILSLLAECSLLSPGGMIILEQDRRIDVSLPDSLQLNRAKQYGDTKILFISLSQEERHENRHLPGEF